MPLTRSVVLVAAMLALSACAGGGGRGGGGPGPTPPVTPAPPPKPPAPPATPYASNCGTTPNAITCWGGPLGRGDFGLQEMQFNTGGSAFEAVFFDNKNTQRTDDDQWVFNYFSAAVIYRYYDTPMPATDGLGRIRVGANYGRNGVTGEHTPGDGTILTLYDITNVLQGGLDYVQLGSLAKPGTPGAPGYFAVGSGYSRPVLPTTGTAKFDGGARGAYVTSTGAVYSTLSDMTLTADFAKASVTGAASNFYVTDSTGAAALAPRDLNFNMSGAITVDPVFGPRFAGTASGTNMSGTVNGAFYGQPGQAPAEIGLSYKLTDTAGGALTGVGGLKRNP